MLPKKSQFSSPEGRALLGRASASAKADNDAYAADPWTIPGGAKNNQPYREPMPSVKVKRAK